MCVVGCLAYARACGNELSRLSVLRYTSDLRRAAPASTSAWVEGARRAWLLRARHAQPSPSLRSFSFQFATPYPHLRFREDHGLPVLGPCLLLPSPRRPPMFTTRDSTAPLGGSAPNRRAAAPPAPHATFLYTNSVAASPPCTSSPYMSSLCIAPPPSSVAGPALAPTLPCRSRTRPNHVCSWPAPHLLRSPTPDHHQVLHARGLAVLMLVHAKLPRRSSTCTLQPCTLHRFETRSKTFPSTRTY
jgi:hypothetical protein